jgi:Fe-Mn family superoxide dismutase
MPQPRPNILIFTRDLMFSVQDLPYELDALQPTISRETMEVHWGKHYKAYTDKLNAALEGYDEGLDKSVEELLSSIEDLPVDIRAAVRNNGGGYYNHTLFWQIMTPEAGTAPSEALQDAIDDSFGSFEDFQAEFSTAAKGVFGSGWAWLAINAEGELEVMSTPNQDNPLMKGNYIPILGLDVWEHAYYLDYQNRRPDYVDTWWDVVNWDRVSEFYSNFINL